MQLGEDVSAPAQAVRGYCLHLHDRPNFNVLIAVSGGSDSVALLRAAVELAQAEGGVVRAATVDHGLRSEAKDEAVWVADLCATLDVDHTTLTVPDLATGAALQARAREARYAALIGWAKGFKGVPLLLGHTRNDVAETFLMRLARGAGTAGLAEMQGDFTRGGVQFGRPLLRQSREDLQGWLRSLDQTWIEDPGNEDPTFDRVKVRRMLPQLDQIGLSVDKLAGAATMIRAAQTALDEDTHDILRRAVTISGGDAIVDLTKLPTPAFERRRRVIMALLRWVGGKPYDPRGAEQWRLLQVLGRSEGPKNVTRTLSGVVMTRGGDPTVRFAREYDPVKTLETPSDARWDRWVIEGPHSPNLTIRALGEHIKEIPEWRDTGIPRASLMATPAVFDGETLISAPVAGLQNGFNARIVTDFHSFLLSR